MNGEFDQGYFQGEVFARLDSLKELIADIKQALEKHETRLRDLEHTSTQVKVWGVVIGGLAGMFGGKLAALIPWAGTIK